jgi:glycosyltransferase involved in cell wall biosynthesis
LGIPVDKRIVGMIACFKPQKAPLDFIRAMRRVADSVPEVHAIMVGDGELRPQIEALIDRQHLGSVVSLLGWRTDIPELLSLCDMVVLTSRWEGLPRVCPQAMAAGVPIVATNVDGIPEAVHEGVNGFLLSPGDIQGIAAKSIYLLTHPDIARKMGRQGQQLVDEFDIRRMVQQQETLYQQLMIDD